MWGQVGKWRQYEQLMMIDQATVIKQKVLFLEPRKLIVDKNYCFTDNGKLFLETEKVKREKDVDQRDCFDQLLECWCPIYFMLTKYIVMQQEKLIENIIFLKWIFLQNYVFLKCVFNFCSCNSFLLFTELILKLHKIQCRLIFF